MNNYQVIDADSQFTTRLKYFPKPWIPEQPVLRIFAQSNRGPRHSVFGEYHNLFPLAAAQLNDEQTSTVLKQIEQLLDPEPPDIIAYPNDSTIFALLPRVLAKWGGSPISLGLSPAFRRQTDYQLRAEINTKSQLPMRSGTLRVLFLDDSFTSGRTEEKAVEAVLDLLGRIGRQRNLVDWYTYVLVDRTDRGVEVELPRKRQPRNRRERVDMKSRRAHLCLGPRSAHPGECPLCAAGARLAHAAEWAVGARAEIRDCLSSAQNFFQQLQLDARKLPPEQLQPEATQALLFLCSQPLAGACFHISEKQFETWWDIVAAILYATINWADSCAYLPRKRLPELFRALLAMSAVNDQECARIISIAAAFLPPSIQVDLLHTLLPDLVTHGRLTGGGALIALAQSGLHNLESEFADDRVAKRLKTLRAAETTAIRKTLSELGRDPSLLPRCEVLRFDISALHEIPNTASHLWCVRMLTAVLHEGKHASFLMHELTRVANPRLNELKSNLAQCRMLFRFFLQDIAPTMAAELDPMLAGIEAADNIEALRPLGLEFIQRFWTNYIEKEFVTDALRIEDLLKTAQFETAVALEDAGLDQPYLEVVPTATSLSRWKAFAPHWEILKGHFSNLFLNAAKHFYLQQPTDLGLHFAALRRDLAFTDGGILSTARFVVLPENGFAYIIFSDRAASAEGKNLFGWYSGLSSAHAMLQLKGGDVRYFSSAEVACGLPGDWAPLTGTLAKIQPVFVNHFVTRLPLLLANK